MGIGRRGGVRFDGCYDVVGCEVLDGGAAMGRVLLVRREGQGPIRWGGVEGRRRGWRSWSM